MNRPMPARPGLRIAAAMMLLGGLSSPTIARAEEAPTASGMLALSPDGRTLAAADGAARARLYEAVTGREKAGLPEDQHTLGRVESAAYQPGAGRLATIDVRGNGATVHVWDIDQGSEKFFVDGHISGRPLLFHRGGVAYTPDGSKLLSFARDEVVKVWDAETGAAVFDLDPDAVTWSLAISPDGRKVATGHDDRTVRIWDLATGQPLERWEVVLPREGAPAAIVSALAYSPDGASLAAAVSRNDEGVVPPPRCELVVRDLKAKMNRFQVDAGAVFLNDVIYSPDGTFLAAIGSSELPVQLRHGQTGAVIGEIPTKDGWLWGAAFLADEPGRMAILGKNEGLQIREIPPIP